MIAELKTHDNFDAALHGEEPARRYLEFVRWGKWASCPHCGNNKAYFIENGERHKCANKLCYKKFSVSTKTLIEASNLSLSTYIVISDIYFKLGGDVKSWEVQEKANISTKAALMVKEKFDFAWRYVHYIPDNKDKTIYSLFRSIFNLYEKKKEFTKWHILKECDNISDINQYRKVVKYAKYWLSRATWMVAAQIEPEDVIAEAFLYMSDNGIKEYNAELITYLIRKSADKLFIEWLKEHPKSNEYRRNYVKRWHELNRRNLGNYYMRKLVKKSNKSIPMLEIRSRKDWVAQKKESVIDFRKKYNILYDFKSHFE